MSAALLRRAGGPASAAALLYAVLAMLFVSPALVPGKTLSNSDTLWFEPPWVSAKPAELKLPSNPDLGDAARYLQPFLRRVVAEAPTPPLWNPSIVGGRPLQANSQSAVFGPYTWPAYVLPFWTALGWIAVLKLWVAGFGTYLLGRALGMSFAGALLAGVVFAFSLRMTTWLIYPTMGVWSFLPWLLLLTDRVVRRPSLLAGAGLAAIVAAQFLTGHVESSFHVLLAAVAFAALRLWQARRAGAPLGRGALAFAGALAGGTALAAVSLVPLLELVWLSADVRERAGESIDRHLPAKDALAIFLPDYWGRPTQTPVRRILLESTFYVGALPLMLGAAALLVRPTLTRVAVALFGGLWLAVVLGVPPFVQVVTRLPVFSSGHNTRLAVLTVFALALLAGWGLDELTSRERTAGARGRRVLAAAGVLLVVPVIAVAAAGETGLGALRGALEIGWLFADPPGSYRDVQGAAEIALSSLIVWLTFAAAGLALLLLRLGGRVGAGAFAALAVALACADLFRAGVGLNPAIDRDVAELPRTGAIRFLERQRPARFASTDEIPQNVIPMDFRIDEARGYDLPIIRRYDRLWRSEIAPGTSVAQGFLDIPLRLGEVTPRALRTLRLLGVRHILRATSVWPDAPPFDRLVPYPPLEVPGLTPAYEGADARVYRVAGAMPRAWVVGAQRVVGSDDAALAAVTGAGFDARREAITEERVPGVPARPASGAPAGTATLVSRSDERVVVRARAQRRGILVLGDTHFPGWKATVDGREVDVRPVDYVFKGVPIGPGTHTVEFRYEPLSWRIGWIVSLVALAGLAATVAAGLARTRRAAGSRPRPAG